MISLETTSSHSFPAPVPEDAALPCGNLLFLLQSLKFFAGEFKIAPQLFQGEIVLFPPGRKRLVGLHEFFSHFCDLLAQGLRFPGGSRVRGFPKEFLEMLNLGPKSPQFSPHMFPFPIPNFPQDSPQTGRLDELLLIDHIHLRHLDALEAVRTFQ